MVYWKAFLSSLAKHENYGYRTSFCSLVTAYINPTIFNMIWWDNSMTVLPSDGPLPHVIKCKNIMHMLILQQQKKKNIRKTYKHIQTTEKTENIILKTAKGLLLDLQIFCGSSTPFRSKAELDEEKPNKKTNNKEKKKTFSCRFLSLNNLNNQL